MAGLERRTMTAAGNGDPEAACATFVRLHYGVARGRVGVLDAAASEASERAEADPVAAGLVDHLRAHMISDAHHDVWLLEDWAAMGRDPRDLVSGPTDAAVADAVGAGYYWTRCVHPVAIVGVLLVVDATPLARTAIGRAEAAGRPARRALATLRMLSDRAATERNDLDQLVDELPLTPAHESIVATAAAHTAERLSAALDEMSP